MKHETLARQQANIGLMDAERLSRAQQQLTPHPSEWKLDCMSAGETASFEVGRLFWRRFRQEVELAKFLGHDIEVYEGSGILSRRFTLRGDSQVIAGFRRMGEALNGLSPGRKEEKRDAA